MCDITRFVGKEVGIYFSESRISFSIVGKLEIGDETYYQVKTNELLCTFTDINVRKTIDLERGKVLICIGNLNVMDTAE